MSRAKRGLKRVVGSLAMEVVLESVRGYLEELLKDVTPEDLYKAIQEDEDPWEHAPPKIRRRGSKWARNLEKYQDRITPQVVLDWLKADRPDLHSLIVNMGPKGTKWLTRRTRNFKEQLWPSKRGLKLVKGAEEDPHEEPLEEPEEIPAKIRWG